MKKKKLRAFIDARGGVCAFARELGVHHSTIVYWFTKQMRPSPQHLEDIIRLSRGKITLKDIYSELLPDTRWK